jgi:hypothetical protein
LPSARASWAQANEELARANEQLALANVHLAQVNEQLTFELAERQRSAEEREHLILQVDLERERADLLAQTLKEERSNRNYSN